MPDQSLQRHGRALDRAEHRLRTVLGWACADASFLKKAWWISGAGQKTWGGADVLIVARRPEEGPGSFYPDPEFVVTPHTAALSGAFISVRDIGSDVIDSMSKYDLYGAMAQAALAYHREHGPGTAEGVAVAAIEAALRTFGAWRFRGGNFEPVVVHPRAAASPPPQAERPESGGRNRSGIGDPPAITLPFFAYGTLKPGELGFQQIAGHVSSRSRGHVPGRLLVRDGLPLLELQETGRLEFESLGKVDGWILGFGDNGEHAYEAIGRFEPSALYRWMTTQTVAGEQVNVLVGRSLNRGGAEEWRGHWSSELDPVFANALPLVRRNAGNLCEPLFKPHPSGLAEAEWDRFFQIKAAYLLL